MNILNIGISGYGWVATAYITAIIVSVYVLGTSIYSSKRPDGKDLSGRWGQK